MVFSFFRSFFTELLKNLSRVSQNKTNFLEVIYEMFNVLTTIIILKFILIFHRTYSQVQTVFSRSSFQGTRTEKRAKRCKREIRSRPTLPTIVSCFGVTPTFYAAIRAFDDRIKIQENRELSIVSERRFSNSYRIRTMYICNEHIERTCQAMLLACEELYAPRCLNYRIAQF